ncbi:MAG TPA: radical SAM protein [Vicinamibacteria bacterium]|nr:radical SAM protein [Vicinamibacteria bacterium]
MTAPSLSSAARKARLVRAFLAGEPVHCTWQLSPRCESFCQFCEHRAESAAEELDTAGCAAVAAELGRTASLLVSFTGSEPFLRGDLAAVVAATAARHFPLLMTNGWLVSRPRARAVWEAGLEAATVSLEDSLADRHDAATGVAGSHARAVRALEVLAGERTRRTQRINVRTRLRDADLGPLERVLTLASRLEATVTVEAAFPLPRLDGDAAAVTDRLRELRRRHPRLRGPGPALEGLGRALSGGVPGCQAGRAFFNVDHRGRVSRCVEFRGAADRVGEMPADGAGVVRSRLRAAHGENDCQACWYASRAEVESLYTVRGFLSGLRALVTA